MSVDDRLLLVIPCYNEAARLDRKAIDEALAHMAWLDLCFVDDGSTDQTAALLESMRAAWPDRVSVVSLARNAGKAEAVRQGLLRASTRSALCGFWDADLAAPLDELIALRHTLDVTSHLEWVWGIRLRALGHRVERQAMRHYLGRVFATVASVFLGVASYDTQCGAKLFRVTPLLRDVIAEPFVSRWVFDAEMLARANALLQHAGGVGVEYSVHEQPLASWHHRAGSKVRATDFIRAIGDLLRVRRDRSRWQRAMRVEDGRRET